MSDARTVGVLVLYNQPRAAAPDSARCTESDAGILAEVAAVEEALRTLRRPFRTVAVQTLADVPRALRTGSERIVVNLVETLSGDVFDVCLVPAVCRALGCEPTGNGATAQTMALDKWIAKAALQGAGAPTPWAVAVPPGATPPMPPAGVRRVIVKPLRVDASEGIDPGSVLDALDASALRAAVERVHARFGHPALVEEFIDGREVNVSLVRRGAELVVMPLAEIDFSAFPAGMPRIVDYAAKWIEDSFAYRNTPRILPADFDPATAERIRDAARAAWHALGCEDYARVDLRVTADGRPMVLEVNPNPDIAPDAGFAAAMHAAGWSFADFVAALLDNAAARLASAGLRRETDAQAAEVLPLAACGGAAFARRTVAADRDAILGLLADTGVFFDFELDIAREVLDEAIRDGAGGHYQSYTAVRRADGAVAGWVCFGPAPCTEGTFDAYWLAVDAGCRKLGVGRALMTLCEELIARRGGRRVVVETAGRVAYEGTRRFYERVGYVECGRVPDFYGDGDDKVMYLRTL
jgi:D-alanine-D-alanine ligase